MTKGRQYICVINVDKVVCGSVIGFGNFLAESVDELSTGGHLLPQAENGCRGSNPFDPVQLVGLGTGILVSQQATYRIGHQACL
jgi:hypothetical protein